MSRALGPEAVPRARARQLRVEGGVVWKRDSLRQSVQMLQCGDRHLQGNSGLKGWMLGHSVSQLNEMNHKEELDSC